MITPSYGLTATERVLPSFTLDWTTGLVQSTVDVARAGVATFVGSDGLIQSASADTQRIDYSTGVAGLLVEESRSNIMLYSQDFTQASWTNLTNASMSAPIYDSPDGGTTACLMTETDGSGQRSIRQSVTTSPTVQNTVSCFCKANGRTTVRLYMDAGGATNGRALADFDLVAKTASAVNVINGATAGTAFIQELANGWFRCGFNAIPSTAGTSIRTIIFMNNGANYTGDGVSGVYFWGAQLEAGAFPTSYIPTTSLAVTRNTDAASITGANFSNFFNDAAGTFFIKSNARNGEDLLTAGSYVLAADATALKKYATTYSADPSATQLDIGKGLHQKIMYYPQALIAAELAAITA